MLGVLEAAQAGEAMSQRRVAADLGVALGLVNAYVKRCVRKGLLKVSQVPARRYAYYLTPEGFAEKSRLTAEYLSCSFGFFRKARADCSAVMSRIKALGGRRIALAGVSDIADIAALCAIEAELEIACVIDATSERERFAGRPVVRHFSPSVPEVDAIVITAIDGIEDALADAVAAVGIERVQIPHLLSAGLQPVAASYG